MALTALFAGVLSLTCTGCAERDTPVPIEPVLVFGGVGADFGRFNYPRAIAADADVVVVVDKSARVQRFDAATGEPVAWFRMRAFDRGKPTGLTIAAHPTQPSKRALYIADTHYHRVVVTELPTEPGVHPEIIAELGGYGIGPGEFVYVTDVAVTVGANGLPERIYVSEYGGNDRITVFGMERTAGADGTPVITFPFERQIGTFGEGPMQFNRPQALAIDPVRTELIVADGCNHRIGRFTLDGELIAWIGEPESGAGLVTEADLAGDPDGASPEGVVFNYPYSVVPLESGEWLVCEFGGNRVRVLDPDARASAMVVRTLGGAGREVGRLVSPWALGVGGADRRTAFVLDSRNSRVQAFRAPAPAPKITAVATTMDTSRADHADTGPGVTP